LRFAHVRDFKFVQDEGVAREVQVVPPSNVTSRIREFDTSVALTMHVSEFVQAIAVTVSPDVQGSGVCADHDAPSSEEKAIFETVFTPSLITAAHVDSPKQLSARIPWPPRSDERATTDWEEAL
jgi:hypothetical protein